MSVIRRMPGREAVWLLAAVLLLGACKSQQHPESFSKGEAFSGFHPADSQLNVLREVFPEAEVRRTARGVRISFASGILFAVNSAQVSSQAKAVLERLPAALQSFPDARLRIEGHTDITGNTELNRTLSQRRAEAVKNLLVSQGMDDARIETIGHGEAYPAATNSTPEGREKNRRVEIYVVY